MMSKKDKWFVIRVVIAFVVFVIAIAFIHWADTPKVEAWEYHAVEAGDTLWSIAKEHNPGFTGDVRHITYEIKKANGKSDSRVNVGEVLEVPVMDF